LPGFAAGSGQFRSWIFTIAHNEVVNVYRSHARHRTSPMPEEVDLVDPDPTPEQHAVASDDQRELWRLLEGLPQRSREVVELRLSGFTSQEIAVILGISDGAVRQAQSRALDQLRQLLIDDDSGREVQRV
jgi:RNA polymerase sigma-70 factor (ECF subfamily)